MTTRSNGHTLVETIIALLVFGVLGIFFVSQIMLTKNTARSTHSQIVAKHEGYASIETLAVMLREARLVTIGDDGWSIDITRTDGTVARAYFDAGEDGDPIGLEDNQLVLIPDLDNPATVRVLAGRTSLVGSQPLFQRTQNRVRIRLRLGDAFDNPTTDVVTGLGHQGYEVETTIYLRNA